MSREFLARKYDEAHRSDHPSLRRFSKKQTLPNMSHTQIGTPCSTGDVTLERLFHYIKAHFESHEAQIRQIVVEMKAAKRIMQHEEPQLLLLRGISPRQFWHL